jgi:hypothetical protein
MPSLPSLAFDPLIAIAVVFATACTDAIYVLFTNAVVAPSPRLPPLPRAAYELPAEMDPGFPTQAAGRRAPEVVRYTGRETRDHSFSDEVASLRGSPQAPHPSPGGGTVLVAHPSRGRDERK